MLLAAVFAVGLNSIEIDLGALIKHYRRVPGTNVVCGIKVVGYHIAGKPGQQFRYARQNFTIPPAGYVQVIAKPRLAHYEFEGRKLPLDDGRDALDQFSFRWITLPAEAANGGATGE